MKIKTTYLAVVVGIGIIAMATLYIYSADRGVARGKTFGDSLVSIQDEVKQAEIEFDSKRTMLNQTSITREEFVEFGKNHIAKMNEILAKYDLLQPPESFVKSVDLLKTSTQKQIESDQYYIEWISTNDTANKVRTDSLYQESFENEMAGIAAFRKAQNEAGQN